MESKEPKKTPAPETPSSPEPVSTPAPTTKAQLVESPTSSPVMASSSGSETVNQVLTILSRLTDYVGEFFVTYQKPLVNVGLIIAAFVAVYLTLSVLDAINHIPLLGFVLAPLFELVGLCYVAWFVWRYLLKAESRQELYKDISSLTSQVTGGGKS
ncbi:CAAD domain-containing protein [Roseofilum casamattae]|uniref:CAAD domain-containing protein n=1 Tax=Roseofilum casamattae BLCC-M143 TaxID=3022442 RepID=A0ABT7BSG6_9CYAN|nr:CAAD domain-containing protein [Roseofilum casamattae]MDJ1182015.1 CAAD domain-containing protein [Roseofilum casamattae BLCC-M143]